MRKLLFAQVVAIAVTTAGSAFAADMPIVRRHRSSNAVQLDRLLSRRTSRRRLRPQGPHRPGAAGAGLVPGAGGTVGVTTVSPNPSGVVIGGQIGCDYQFASTVW